MGRAKSILVIGVAILFLSSVVVPSLAVQVKQTSRITPKTNIKRVITKQNTPTIKDKKEIRQCAVEAKAFLREWQEKEKHVVYPSEMKKAYERLRSYVENLRNAEPTFLDFLRNPFGIDYELLREIKETIAKLEAEIEWLEYALSDSNDDIERNDSKNNIAKEGNSINCISESAEGFSVRYGKKRLSKPAFSTDCDLILREVYISLRPRDWNGDYKIDTPHAGDEIFVHFKMAIKGEKVSPYHFKLEFTQIDEEGKKHTIFEHEWSVNEGDDLLQPGEYAVYILDWPHIPGGENYNLTITLDNRGEVEETNEENNKGWLNFKVVPTDAKFDFEANEIWLSSQPNDWEKEHVLTSPIRENTPIFFHFKYTLWGFEWNTCNPYTIYFDINPGGEWYISVEKEEMRKGGRIWIICLSLGEDNSGWLAPDVGEYEAKVFIDVDDDVKEWLEVDNNEVSENFVIEPTHEAYFPNEGEKWEHPGISFLSDAHAQVTPREGKPGLMRISGYAYIATETSARAHLYCNFKPSTTGLADIRYRIRGNIKMSGGKLRIGMFSIYTTLYVYVKNKFTGGVTKITVWERNSPTPPDLAWIPFENTPIITDRGFIKDQVYELGVGIYGFCSGYGLAGGGFDFPNDSSPYGNPSCEVGWIEVNWH